MKSINKVLEIWLNGWRRKKDDMKEVIVMKAISKKYIRPWQFLACLLVLATIMVSVPVYADPPAPFAGSGTEADPCLITSAEDLLKLAELVNDGGTAYATAGVCYKLTKDISLSDYGKSHNSGKGWVPIGVGDALNPFNGNFDGGGHKITGLYINDDITNAGLFGVVSASATVEKVTLNGADIVAISNVGGIAGEVKGTVTDCAYLSLADGTDSVRNTLNSVGGIAGYVDTDGIVQNCYSTGRVGGFSYIGGVAGNVDGTVHDCYSTSYVQGSNHVGGVAGQVIGTLQNCYSTGVIGGQSLVGGVTGISDGTVQFCAALNLYVSASNSVAGRVVGVNNGGSLSDNMAFGGMNISENGEIKDISATARHNDVDGETRTAGVLQTNNAFPAAMTQSPWVYESGKLPGLSEAINMPNHLVPPVQLNPPTNLSAGDTDSTYPGVDGRDFHVSWTPSISQGVTGQQIYILPQNTSIDVSTQTAAATFNDNTTHEWTGNAALTWDSANQLLTAGNYSIYIVAKNQNQSVQSSANILVVSDPERTSSTGGGGSGGGGGTAQPVNLTVRVNDSGGNLIQSVAARLDSAGTAAVEVSSALLTDAFAKSKTSENGMKTVGIAIPKIDGAKAYEPTLPAGFLTSGNLTEKVEIKTGIASVNIPGNMLPAANVAGAQKVSLTIAAADKSKLEPALQEQIGGRPIIELNLKIDGKQTSWNNESAPVAVSIPYTPSKEELKDPEHIIIWYIDGKGNAVSVPNGRYDPANGTVTFTTTHFSQYAVAYANKTFSDLGNAEWARESIETMAAKGIINGTGKDIYSPAAKITRADYIVLLVRTLGLTADFDSNFDDVQPDTYYYEAVGTAKKLGIAEGGGNNLFSPKENISRQEMMTLMTRALEKLKEVKTTNDTADLNKFSDKDNIAGYAKGSIAILIKEGLISGSGDKLNPCAYTTRAEAAVFLYRIYNKY